MRTLLRSTAAYRRLATEEAENRLSHAYLLVFDDARNLRAALKEFAAVFFGAGETSEKADANASDKTNDRGRSATNASIPSKSNIAAPVRDTEKTRRRRVLIEEEAFADCLFFPEDGKKFSVEDAEKIREESVLRPVEGERKLFVAGDFADATPQAQNKLLKLLEEPPAGVFFLLGTTATYPVLPTVLSRTEKLEIPPFPVNEIEACLRRIYPQTADFSLCAAASGGQLGTAQNLLDGGYYKALSEDAFLLAEANPFRLPALVKRIGETKYRRELLSLLRLIFRDALMMKTTELSSSSRGAARGAQGQAEKYLLLRAEKTRLARLADGYSVRALVYAQEALSDAEKQIRFNAVFPQCLELCMAAILERNNK